MRISDWSSDVCSSDLESFEYRPGMARIGCDVGKPHREPRTVAELEMRGFRTYTLKGGDQIRIERELENMFGIGLPLQLRSEERRVGEEWVRPGRSRGSPYD